MDQNPYPTEVNEKAGGPLDSEISIVDDKDRCLHLCTDIHNELMKDSMEDVCSSIWIHKEKISVDLLVSPYLYHDRIFVCIQPTMHTQKHGLSIAQNN